MKTIEFILWSTILICTIWLWWRQTSYVKTLKSILGDINGMVSEAKTVRDELQKLFDDFEKTIENEMKIEDLKAQIEAIVKEEQALDKGNEEKTISD